VVSLSRATFTATGVTVPQSRSRTSASWGAPLPDGGGRARRAQERGGLRAADATRSAHPGRRGREPRGGARPLGPQTALCLAVVVAAALLTACGSSAGGTPSPSAASPGGKPFVGSPAAATAAYWALVDAGDYAGLRAACAPGSAAALTPASDDIERARLLRVARVRRASGGAQVEAEVRIVPAGEATPWGETGTHTLFVDLAEAPGGGWLVTSWGTGP
jgi:hypothetical protein